MSKVAPIQRPLFDPWLAWEQFPDSVREQALDVLTALNAANRRMGRDTVFDAGAGFHRDWKAFATPAMLILPELSPLRSGSQATTRAKPGSAERIRFMGNRLEPSPTLRQTGKSSHLSFQLQEGHPQGESHDFDRWVQVQ
jgi:hypothetical protein